MGPEMGPKRGQKWRRKYLLHAGVGKVSFGQDKVQENIQALIDAITKAKPSGAKGTYIKKITLTSTMGPSITV